MSLSPEEIGHLKEHIDYEQKVARRSCRVIAVLFIAFAIFWMVAILVLVGLFMSNPNSPLFRAATP